MTADVYFLHKTNGLVFDRVDGVSQKLSTLFSDTFKYAKRCHWHSDCRPTDQDFRGFYVIEDFVRDGIQYRKGECYDNCNQKTIKLMKNISEYEEKELFKNQNHLLYNWMMSPQLKQKFEEMRKRKKKFEDFVESGINEIDEYNKILKEIVEKKKIINVLKEEVEKGFKVIQERKLPNKKHGGKRSRRNKAEDLIGNSNRTINFTADEIKLKNEKIETNENDIKELTEKLKLVERLSKIYELFDSNFRERIKNHDIEFGKSEISFRYDMFLRMIESLSQSVGSNFKEYMETARVIYLHDKKLDEDNKVVRKKELKYKAEHYIDSEGNLVKIDKDVNQSVYFNI